MHQTQPYEIIGLMGLKNISTINSLPGGLGKYQS